METKSRKMKFTDLKDMLNQTGEVCGEGDGAAHELCLEER